MATFSIRISAAPSDSGKVSPRSIDFNFELDDFAGVSKGIFHVVTVRMSVGDAGMRTLNPASSGSPLRMTAY